MGTEGMEVVLPIEIESTIVIIIAVDSVFVTI